MALFKLLDLRQFLEDLIHPHNCQLFCGEPLGLSSEERTYLKEILTEGSLRLVEAPVPYLLSISHSKEMKVKATDAGFSTPREEPTLSSKRKMIPTSTKSALNSFPSSIDEETTFSSKRFRPQ